jgi:type IV fimbrial biogenesis protein FimT
MMCIEGHAPARSARGFTLIEAAIVVSILAIVSAVALPSFAAFVADQRARSAASDLVTSILAARSEAIKRNADVAIQPLVVGGVVDWGAGWVVTGPDGVVIDRKEVGAGRLAGPSDPPQVVFTGAGRMSAAGGAAIELRGPDGVDGIGKRCVLIDLSGRPQLKRGACG